MSEPFTAELALALLLGAAEPPFAPITGGLEVRVEEDAGLAEGEVVRLVDPRVRQFAHAGLVPLGVARELAEQREQCAQQRDLHWELWRIPCTE